MPSPEAAITTTVSRILVLSHSAFEALSVTYPMASRMVMQNLVRRQTQLLSDTLDESTFNLTDEERRLILSDAQADAAGVAGGHADADALEELLDKLPLHQTMQLQTLRNLKQAATQAAEQLGLSRATKLLTSVAANNIQEVKLMLGQVRQREGEGRGEGGKGGEEQSPEGHKLAARRACVPAFATCSGAVGVAIL